MQETGQIRTDNNLIRVIIFIVLTTAYLGTAPGYHTTAIDSYHFAYIISEHEPFQVSTRLFLWLASMQGLYWLVSLVSPDPDPFVVVGYANAIQASLAVIFFERLLSRHFDVPPRASWLTALIFAASYGTWRYATELEVYAPAMLVSILLLLLAFSVDATHSPIRWRRIAAVAAAGALASIFYQPLGIVAGIALPVYFVLRLRIQDTVRYCVSYGVMLAASLYLVNYLKAVRLTGSPLSVLDTDGKVPSLPDLTAIAASFVAFLQNLLSVNWIFAFPPTRRLIEDGYSHQFAQELIATDPSYWGYRIFIVTIPAALFLIVTVYFRLRKTAVGPRVSAQELSMLSFLGVYALMVLSLHPEGFEAWLPTLVPLLLLLGSRVAGPLEKSGHTTLLVMLVALFTLHNWFAGVGIFANAERDYNRILGEPALARLGADDLVIVGTDWPLVVYLKYVGKADTLLVQRHTPEIVLNHVEETLQGGNQVLIYSDVISPSVLNMERAGHLPAVLTQLPEQALAQAEKIEIGDLGFALLLKNDVE